ncbi:MAG: glycosyltransferase family 2 protein [Bacteroidales bacterium]|nr:glycosyltransferase family 2 protein [Bacteroidales bacterium]
MKEEHSNIEVSILLPTYNQEAYIAQALDSLLQQEVDFRIEILIGDDASTDQTSAICSDYALRFPDTIRWIRREENMGLMPNYLDLMVQAKGRYLADCGGDDWWLGTDRLTKQVAYLEQHPAVGMVCGRHRRWLETSQCYDTDVLDEAAEQRLNESKGFEAVADYVNGGVFPNIVLGTALYRQSAMRRLMDVYPRLFYGSHVYCEDLPLTLGLLFLGPVHFIQEDFFVYRILSQSMSHAHSPTAHLEGFAFKALLQTLEIVEVLTLPKGMISDYLNRQVSDQVYYAVAVRDLERLRWLRQWTAEHHLSLPWKSRILLRLGKNRFLRTIIRNRWKQR